MDKKENIDYLNVINLNIEKMYNIHITFLSIFSQNTLSTAPQNRISTNSLKYFSTQSNSDEFKKIEDILMNKFSQINQTIATQFSFWSQIFYVKNNTLQSIPSIFRFIMINSIYTLIDASICLYKWSELLNKLYKNKQCIVTEKKSIFQVLRFDRNYNYFIEHYPYYEEFLTKILHLKDNIIHPCNTYDDKNLIIPQKDIFGINSTLYTIDLLWHNPNLSNSLFFLKLKTLKRINQSDKIYNPTNENELTIFDLFDIWTPFVEIFEKILNESSKLLF